MKNGKSDLYNAREIAELLLDCGFTRAKQTIARDIQQNLKTLDLVKKSGWYVKLTRAGVVAYLEILNEKRMISEGVLRSVLKELEKGKATEPTLSKAIKDDLTFGEVVDFYEKEAEIIHRVLQGRVRTVSRVY